MPPLNKIIQTDKKVVVFLDKDKKWYLIYNTIDDLLGYKEPLDCKHLPLQRLNDIDEIWMIEKILTYSNRKLSIQLKKIK